MSSSAQTVVVVEDTFDDADRDNNGFTDDGNDTPVTTPDGIKWFSADGTFFSNTLTNPVFSIVNDDVTGGFNNGNALRMDPLQSGPDVTGFFGQRVTLGQDVGDKLVVSFDWRTTDTFLPGGDGSGVRFGLWQDTDSAPGSSDCLLEIISGRELCAPLCGLSNATQILATMVELTTSES